MVNTDGISYFVLLLLLVLVINWLFHVHALSSAWRENKRQLLQIGIAFVAGALFAWLSHRGVLSALHILPEGGGLDSLVTGAVIAIGSDNLSLLQTLGGQAGAPQAPSAGAAGGAIPDVVQVSGQVRLVK
jgi:hypothetical protein